MADRRARGDCLTAKRFMLIRGVDPRKEGGVIILEQTSELSTGLADLINKGRTIWAVAEQAIVLQEMKNKKSKVGSWSQKLN